MVMGLPSLPKGGKVGVGDGRVVGVWVGVVVSTGVRVGEGVGVGAGAEGTHAEIIPIIRMLVSRSHRLDFVRFCFTMVSSHPFGPGGVGIFFFHELLRALNFVRG